MYWYSLILKWNKSYYSDLLIVQLFWYVNIFSVKLKFEHSGRIVQRYWKIHPKVEAPSDTPK